MTTIQDFLPGFEPSTNSTSSTDSYASLLSSMSSQGSLTSSFDQIMANMLFSSEDDENTSMFSTSSMFSDSSLLGMSSMLGTDSLYGSSGISSLFGSDDSYDTSFFPSNMLTPILYSLIEQLMSSSMFGGTINSLAQATQFHINQFDAESEVGGDSQNANCGPTSLAMALHAIGYGVQGENGSLSNGQVVDLARRSMVKDQSRDGVDSSGNRVEGEHNSFTNLDEIAQGVYAAGAYAKNMTANANSIYTALQSGAKVIVSGTFDGKTPLPWTGDRSTDSDTAPGGASGHFVVVSGIDTNTGQFIVNDPARQKPHLVSGDTLEYFMRDNAGVLAVSSNPI